MSQMSSPAGVLPVVQTPYSASDEIDETQLHAELTWIIDQGADGLTTGMVSEILRLTYMERQRLTEAVCSVALARGRAAIISCGDESVRAAVSQAQHAAECGATALMANPPVTISLDDREVYDYFVRIIEATHLPLIVQDASGYIGRPLSLSVLSRLLDNFGDRVLFKPEAQPLGQRLTALREATAGAARVLEGTGGAALVDSFRRGIVGTMPGSELVWAVRKMWDAVTEGDWATAYAIGGPMNTLVSLQTTVDAFIAVEKHLLWRQGVFTSAHQRPPRGYILDYETAAEVERLFNQMAVAAGQPERVLIATVSL